MFFLDIAERIRIYHEPQQRPKMKGKKGALFVIV